MITVLATPPLNTVQDLGRSGHRSLGVGLSGAMDRLALRIGNILLGDAEGAACVEVQTFPFVARFEVETAFVVTGADAVLDLDGLRIWPWVVTAVAPGQVLTIRTPQAGARACLCVAGGIEVPAVLGSRSTQLRGAFGGIEGRALRSGDVLPIQAIPSPGGYGAVPPSRFLGARNEEDGVVVTSLRAIPAADYAHFTDAAQARFWNGPWRITPQSDRVGYRLQGDALALQAPMELRSYGIVPGIVQVPPAGEPIVQMADANTAGGYPRMACVIEADLWKLAQARIGTAIRFERCDHADGVAAAIALERYLATLRSATALCRRSIARRQGNSIKTEAAA
ncbi:biotin-dependent carboxyltransferase family protein [Sphingomonadaceae bacterium OTU29MARTA1]|nr:biotin-dependent carboxyltransferase family protein [Sphingomonadaceae bacterium OTU29MARTA1]